jgi:hypothetical protein
MSWSNSDALHRHGCHAFEDFERLRRMRWRKVPTPDPDEEELWHSLSHHLRHAVYRSGHEVEKPRIKTVRRTHVDRKHA